MEMFQTLQSNKLDIFNEEKAKLEVQWQVSFRATYQRVECEMASSCREISGSNMGQRGRRSLTCPNPANTGTNTQIHKYLNTQIHKYLNTQIHAAAPAHLISIILHWTVTVCTYVQIRMTCVENQFQWLSLPSIEQHFLFHIFALSVDSRHLTNMGSID